MPNIIFIDSPTTPQDRIGDLSKIIDLTRDRPHLGMLSLAAVTRKNNWNTAAIDPYPYQWSDAEICQKVADFNPDVIGISAQTLGVINGNRLACHLKTRLPDVPIILGGPHCTSAPYETLDTFRGYDIAVLGEGEETVMELINTLINRPAEEKLKCIDGIAFRDGNGRIIINRRREYIRDLDSLPMPAWDLLPEYPFKYSPSLSSGAGSKPTGSLFTSRGCPWRCKFCDRGVFGDATRTFSAKYVMNQILHLYDKYDIREIMFGDDTFFVDRNRTMELLAMIKDSKLDFRWECMSRVTDVDEELCRLAKASGCFEISFGIESADDRVSQSISKPINQKNIHNAIDTTKNAGIRARGYFIFGLPGETRDTLQTTTNFIKKSGLDDVAIFACTPYPGSELHGIASKYGEFERKWNKMNNVAVVFVPHGLTSDYIDQTRMKTIRKFYINPTYIIKWTWRLFREGGWKELKRRGGMYTRFFKNILAEFISGLGRGA